MKGNKTILIVFSILLLTLSSGLLFYKNLFDINAFAPSQSVDFDELKTIDLKINLTTLSLRKNLITDWKNLEIENLKVKELLNLMVDMNRNSEELLKSVKTIQLYFENKSKLLNAFKISLSELKSSAEALQPLYNELQKKNIKFSLDKRDFYKDVVFDSLLYLNFTNSVNEAKLIEDKKILSQIISYANSPNPYLVNLAKHTDVILKQNKELNKIFEAMTSDNSIDNEISIVSKYQIETKETNSKNGELFLTILFGAIFIYLTAIITVLLRKLA
jgi:hypothetical protein